MATRSGSTLAVSAREWLHENKRDSNGRCGLFWGVGGPQTEELQQWRLNDQAPVARAYLRVGPTSPAALPGDFDGDRKIDASCARSQLAAVYSKD